MQKSLDPGEKSSMVEGLAKVREAIQGWHKQNHSADEYQWKAAARVKNTREQLFEEIGVYLGSKMTQALSQDLGKTLEDNQKFIMAAEPMLAAFFGNRAAARVHEISFRIASQEENRSANINPAHGGP